MSECNVQCFLSFLFKLNFKQVFIFNKTTHVDSRLKMFCSFLQQGSTWWHKVGEDEFGLYIPLEQCDQFFHCNLHLILVFLRHRKRSFQAEPVRKMSCKTQTTKWEFTYYHCFYSHVCVTIFSPHRVTVWLKILEELKPESHTCRGCECCCYLQERHCSCHFLFLTQCLAAVQLIDLTEMFSPNIIIIIILLES